MQVDFKSEQSTAERLLVLRPMCNRGLYIVVKCGGCQIIHFGTLEAINAEGTVLALNCPTEDNRNEYEGNRFTQHKRERNKGGGLMVQRDRFQYIPIALIHRVIDNTKIF